MPFGSVAGNTLAPLDTPSEISVFSRLNNLQTLEVLSAARNLDPNPARGGGDIMVVDGAALVPQDGPVGTGVDIITKKPASNQISLYVVREGDTLSAIADMFDVNANTIRWANNLGKGSAIRPGDSLIILPINGVRHTVAKGDTLASIVKRYDADTQEVLLFNGLEESGPLVVGSTITIPGGEMPVPKASASTRIVKQSSGTKASVSVGWLVNPVLGAVHTQGIHGYNAVDLGAPIGTPVRAAASGKVILSRSGGWNGGYGSYIVIDHGNGVQTLYAHLSANNVGFGETVAQGDVIGKVGSTGRSTGPHLHFEVRGAKNPF